VENLEATRETYKIKVSEAKERILEIGKNALAVFPFYQSGLPSSGEG